MGRGVTFGIRADPCGNSGTGRTDGCQRGKFMDWGLTDEGVGLLRGKGCEILAQDSIGLIGYSYQQVATSFPKTHSKRTLRLSVLGSEQFEDG